jgi:hypothetical protein
MRIADREIKLCALRLGLETHANQIKLFLEALGDTGHHVVHELPHGPAHGIGFTRIVRRQKRQLAGIVLDGDQRVLCQRKRAQGALDVDLVILESNVHTLG